MYTSGGPFAEDGKPIGALTGRGSLHLVAAADRHEADLLATQLDLKLVAGLEAELGCIGLADE
jgi:hypothetical protein